MKNNYFTLFPCCMLVKGAKMATINDLQRNKIFKIPLSFYELFHDGEIDFDNCLATYSDPQEVEVINQYIEYLKINELGVYNNQKIPFLKIDTSHYYDNKIINNAIIDFDPMSTHDIKRIGEELTQLRCESVELRYFGDIKFEIIENHLKELEDTLIRNIEIFKRKDEKLTVQKEFNLAKEANFRVGKLSLYNCSKDTVYHAGDFTVMQYSKDIIDESFCGSVNEFFFVSGSTTFIEAKNYNSCLNRKIAVDRKGYIKNCPSMDKVYGNSDNGDTLIKVAHDPDFQKMWHIKKDDIEVCKDCEFRYVCQDCRAYIINPDNIYSKPAKCYYDPY